MAILVTGAAGFIGLNLIEHLLSASRSVVALDYRPLPELTRRYLSALPGKLAFIPGAIETASDLATAFAAAPIDTVIHCAVITAGAQREAKDPEAIVATNVQVAVAAITATARYGAKRFIYPSSGAVYGYAAREASVLDEDTLLPKPTNLYAATKWAAEILLNTIARSNQIEFAAIRLGTVFGPWEHATGVRDTLSPMYQTISLLKRNEPAILTTAHTADYIYSRDVAAGLAALADAPTLLRSLYNLGTGRTSTASQWCAELAALKPNFVWRHAAIGDAPNVITHTLFNRPAMNVENIARDANFRPSFGLTDAARDYLESIEKYHTP
jgi:nucleoside-diphosphate-sugar epimerase